jgi:uncharacterized protein
MEMLREYPLRAAALVVVASALALSPQASHAQNTHAAAPRIRTVIPPDEAPALSRAEQGKLSQVADGLNANTLTVISGNVNAAWLTVAYDLSAVLDDGDKLRILPMIGKGGVQNLRDVRLLKGVDLGITITAMMSSFRRSKELGSNIDDRIVYITKLFEDEMQLVVHTNSGITSIEQLRGKKVNFSDAGSGTQWLLRDLFTRLGIDVQEVNMGQGDALERMRNGEVAATILIGAVPAPAFTKLKPTDGFRLIPVQYYPQVYNDYLPANISAEDYPGLIQPGASVETIAVSALMIAYNWPKNSDRYRRLEKFVDAFFSKIEEFRKPPRYPKWRDVNLAATVPGWKRFAPAEEWLQRNGLLPNAVSASNADNLRSQFEQFVTTRGYQNTGLTGEQRERLYGDFLEWARARERR